MYSNANSAEIGANHWSALCPMVYVRRDRKGTDLSRTIACFASRSSCTVFNHHPACNPHGNSASGNRGRTAAESPASVSPGWLAGSTFKTARRMARYFPASTDRALPGWLIFSTAIRVLALGLPFGDGRCSATCRFLDRVTFLLLRAWGV